MALTKDYEIPQGIIGEYHRLQKVEILPSEGRVDILFAIYVNKAAKEAAKLPLYYQSVSIPLDHFTEDPRTVFYTAARTHKNSYLATSSNTVDPDQSTNISNTVALRPEYVATVSLINGTIS
jgi:hypothetical protein